MSSALIFLLFSVIIGACQSACPQGWQQSIDDSNKCYSIIASTKKNWIEAKAFCNDIAPNAQLTSISSAFESVELNALTITTYNISFCDDQIWIGAFDANGQFAWSDGTAFEYSTWQTGEPTPNYQCVSSSWRTSRSWKTMDCGTENCFICEVYMDDMCTTSLPATNTPSTTLKDCKDWFDQGNRTDGIYPINPDGKGSFNAYCDMTTDGGGWTVFQRRNDDSLSFYDKTWCEYKIGFNNGLENNLWLGNDHIHSLSTKDTNVELRIDLWGDRDPTSPNLVIYLWEKHTNFFIDNEANFYTLHISSAFTGNASTDPSSTMHNSNNLRFSTNDTMNGANPVCFETYNNNGWWISSSIPCSHEALNGKYTPTMWGGSGFCWYTGTYWVNPKQSRMMLRRII